MSGAGGGLVRYPVLDDEPDRREARTGDLVRFAPNPGNRDLVVEARVVGHRFDPRRGKRGGGVGWLETRDRAGVFRSVRPSQVRIVEEE